MTCYAQRCWPRARGEEAGRRSWRPMLVDRGRTDWYLAAANVRHFFPALRADFEAPRLLRENGRVHSGPMLWIAPRGHNEFMHFDPDDGWLPVALCACMLAIVMFSWGCEREAGARAVV